ncbi:selenocysteine-specific translation elongation factor [Mangrovibacter yixingensis]|uniref:selenocysteine-specific translation elongation factor n=1 Tax=Mangrovibacter yixingensis TaxID=1529639 RepID=UPI001CFF1A8C|nr:selenocysteine-specific translation elongation factor [Mangrovibacter yixingensis]
MIIATAGHVDHGKTSLIQALTGVNADRLPEEKQRGMTIDLGFAYWPQPDGRVIGFIDVPGHEKFLANMLAGVGGIDHALLVVACDDGVMAQTREHLAILQLTGQPDLTVVLTKSDRVSAERIEEVRESVHHLLLAYGWHEAQFFVTSVSDGTGIDALREHLLACEEQSHRTAWRFRLAIDRAFTVKGAGLVVTGTALSGTVQVGDTLWLAGADKPMRVRGLHAQNQPVQQATAGQRIALNLSGDAQKADISRGDWLLENSPPSPGAERVIVTLKRHSPLQQWQPLHIYHGASHITGRVSILEDDLAELVLDTPLLLADNDDLVLRDISARQTLAGARVVLLNSPKRGKRQPEFLAWLKQLARCEDDESVLRCHLQRHAVSLADFAWARQLREPEITQLAQGTALCVEGQAVGAGLARRWQEKLLATLAEYHQNHDDQPGPGRERLRRMALPAEHEGLVLGLIEQLRQQGEVVSRQGWLHLPGHEPGFSPAAEAIWHKVEGLFADDPWWVRDLAKKAGEDEQTMRQVLRQAAQFGLITAIVKDRYYRQERIQQFADLIRALDPENGSTSAADFRDQLGIGRKLAVQILEYFDRTGFTRRRGNDHLLRDRNLFQASLTN